MKKPWLDLPLFKNFFFKERIEISSEFHRTRFVSLKKTYKKSSNQNPYPLPDIEGLWKKIRMEYFPLDSAVDLYEVSWSKRRQKRTLASCNLSKRKITVAKELAEDRYIDILEPLLYHEMCHAIIGTNVQRTNGKRQWHGRQFKYLESLHPKIPHLNHWIKSGGWLSAIRRERTLSRYKL